jgi:hypothetical protein
MAASGAMMACAVWSAVALAEQPVNLAALAQ